MIAMLVGFLACPQGPQWIILPGTQKMIFIALFLSYSSYTHVMP